MCFIFASTRSPVTTNTKEAEEPDVFDRFEQTIEKMKKAIANRQIIHEDFSIRSRFSISWLAKWVWSIITSPLGNDAYRSYRADRVAIAVIDKFKTIKKKLIDNYQYARISDSKIIDNISEGILTPLQKKTGKKYEKTFQLLSQELKRNSLSSGRQTPHSIKFALDNQSKLQISPNPVAQGKTLSPKEIQDNLNMAFSDEITTVFNRPEGSISKQFLVRIDFQKNPIHASVEINSYTENGKVKELPSSSESEREVDDQESISSVDSDFESDEEVGRSRLHIQILGAPQRDAPSPPALGRRDENSDSSDSEPPTSPPPKSPAEIVDGTSFSIKQFMKMETPEQRALILLKSEILQQKTSFSQKEIDKLPLSISSFLQCVEGQELFILADEEEVLFLTNFSEVTKSQLDSTTKSSYKALELDDNTFFALNTTKLLGKNRLTYLSKVSNFTPSNEEDEALFTRFLKKVSHSPIYFVKDEEENHFLTTLSPEDYSKIKTSISLHKKNPRLSFFLEPRTVFTIYHTMVSKSASEGNVKFEKSIQQYIPHQDSLFLDFIRGRKNESMDVVDFRKSFYLRAKNDAIQVPEYIHPVQQEDQWHFFLVSSPCESGEDSFYTLDLLDPEEKWIVTSSNATESTSETIEPESSQEAYKLKSIDGNFVFTKEGKSE